MASTNTANPGMNYIYQAPQILIPPQLPLILKTYIKAAIRTQPRDLLTWSAYYFKCVHGGLVPPVKRHLEFPLFSTAPWSFTPGFLHVLISQMGREGFVPVPLLYEKWQGLTLNKSDLDRILLLRHYPKGVMDIAELVAIAAGHLCKTLAATMSLVCELLTQEPEGGNAKIPFALFRRLYRMLAELDCGPVRPDEIVVQDIILPFGAKESKLWSIPEGISPEIRDFIRKHFQAPHSAESDNLEEEEAPELESLTLSSCVDVPRPCLARPCLQDSGEHKPCRKSEPDVTPEGQQRDSREGLQVWGDTCQHRGYPLESSEEESVSASQPAPSEVPAEELVKETPADRVEADAETQHRPEETEGRDIDDAEENEMDIASLLTISSLPKLDPHTEDQLSSRQEDENSLGLSFAGFGLGGPPEFGPHRMEGESLTQSEAESQISFASMGEILLRYHVPGIGPPVPPWQIEQVLDFMLHAAAAQDRFVMPRNIRSRGCPPLDIMEAAEVPGDTASYDSIKSRATLL